ncbi:MAG: hypothetical protein ACLR23_15990 [Clostridia bacterium]
MLETYPGDPMVIRLLDGAHEEQHAFNIAGMSWRKEITNPRAPLAQEQTIGISEAFNIRIDEAYGAGDYLYYYGGIDDLWLGLWGIIRAYRQIQDHLLPLCPDKKIMVPPTTPPKMRESATSKSPQFKNSSSTIDTETMIQKASCSSPLAQAQDVLSGRRDPVLLFYGQMQAIDPR